MEELKAKGIIHLLGEAKQVSEKMRKVGSKGAPTAKAFKQAKKTAKK